MGLGVLKTPLFPEVFEDEVLDLIARSSYSV
jgi:hypothetical protein